MTWGQPGRQEYYKRGQQVQQVRLDQIDGVCKKCRYLTLKAGNDFEKHNGGLTVARASVTVVDDAGNVVKRLTGVRTYQCCNACVNKWK